ncbi:hypothetical protein F416_gp077 [Salmonella typhimurium phage PhiSH19]|uniref:DUF4326 domain-containing protein n=2 Tax=Kuttervirus TaxID=2169536 RepID=A0A385IU04_9CAUD|nr:hypothetical protein F416_gp077 [Salmonella phage Sh19]YP_009881201.1 hypothetical protein HYP68_gp184 [Salmonella phage SenASZ3]AER70209.1 NrdA.1 [Salmonella phage Sh19]AXY86575.1 hypothetical protein SeSz3_184 [Salmonella phage SenASZ3]CAB5494375.1 Phage protein [Salmonella phage Se_AO1]
MKVVHFKKEPYDIYIGRPGKWGNDFEVKDHGRGVCIELFEDDLYVRLIEGDITEDELLELDGKTLGCWCKPRPCHGDVYVKVIGRIKLFRKLGKSFTEYLRQTYAKSSCKT